MYLDDHHGDGRLAIWAARRPGCRRCSSTGYRSARTSATWVGVHLTASTEEIAGVVGAWLTRAPKRLADSL